MIKLSVVATEVRYSNFPSKEPAGMKVVGRQPQTVASLYPSHPEASPLQVALLMTEHC